ncbi:MAG TPA: Gfo/Idh/MocA family oxidoreductase [Chryseolinea sp.]|nr:Gfo/Idh/MocA family oxidoreductase [Chryseolinea sp.]
MKVRICIVGNGLFANKVHYPSLASLHDVEIVGICAFDEEKLGVTAKKFNIPTENIYVSRSGSDYQKMLIDLCPDGVYVIGPPGQMLDIWIWCLRNKFNLFIEKPMGLTLHHARTLAHLAEENNCITQVSHQRRSSPLLQKVREECVKKGNITHAIVEFSKYDIVPMIGDRDRMLDDYTHAVDTARYICGGEVVEVESHCRRLMVPDINWIGAHLHFNNGSSCYVIGNWTSGRRMFRVNVHAPGICGEVDLEKEGYVYADGDVNGVRYDTKEVAGSDELFVYGGFQRKSREFINSLFSGQEETSSPFRDALKTMEVCETILAQALIKGV